MISVEKVEGHPSLLRDKNSKAIISTDVVSLKEYKSKKALKDDVARVSEDINILKKEFSEIKALLLKLAQNNNT